jgi:hypothetical protein
MQLFDKYEKFIPFIYIAFLIFLFVVGNSALNYEEVKEISEEEDKKDLRVHPARVTLNVQGGDSYTVNLQTNDTVDDLLDELRAKNGFLYEKVAYTYGTELDNVGGLAAQDGFTWKVYKGDEDITFEIGRTRLEDEDVFVLKLEER